MHGHVDWFVPPSSLSFSQSLKASDIFPILLRAIIAGKISCTVFYGLLPLPPLLPPTDLHDTYEVRHQLLSLLPLKIFLQ